MAKNLSLRTKLLSTSALAVAGTFWLGASPALAIPAGSCVTAGTSAVTITCTGNVPYQVYADVNNTTITLNPDARVSESGDTAILLSTDNSALVMSAGSSAFSSGSGAQNAVAANQSADVTLNGASTITLEQYDLRSNSYALNTNGFDGSNITLNGGSSINFAGGSYDNKYDGHRAGGIGAFGEKIKITLNGESTINVTGAGQESDAGQFIQNDYAGVFMSSTAEQIANRNTITLNGGSSINVTREGVDTYGSITGIYANTVSDGKYAADITLNNSSVHVTGAGISSGKKYAGISNEGADARVTLNGSQVVVTGASVNDNNTYVGLSIVQHNNTNAASGGLALINGSSVTVNANGTGENAELIGAFIDNKYLGTKVGAFTMDGGSTITLNANAATIGAVGIASKGYAPVITMSNGSAVTINAHGGSTNAKYFGAEIFGIDQNNGGGHGRITLNSGSSINLTGAGASDSKYAGILTVGYTNANKYAPAVTLNDSSININDNAGHGNKYVGVISFGGGPITLNGTSSINLGSENGSDASKYVGILAFTSTGMVAPQIVLNDTSSVNITGSGYSATAKYLGIGLFGEGGVVTLNGHSSVNLEVRANSKYAAGIFETGTDNQITLNGNATVRVFGGSYANGAGIYMAGDGGALTLNGHSHIDATYSPNVHGVIVQGDDTSVTLNDFAAIYAGGNAAGILDLGDSNTIVIGQHAYVAGAQGIIMDGDFGTLIVRGDVAGYSGTAIETSGGGNSSVTLDSAWVNGFVLGGGTDTLTLAGTGDMLSGAQGFGLLNMDGVHWNLLAGTVNSADEVSVTSGRLAVNGTLATDVLTVHSGGSLGGTGTITGDIVVEAGGAIAPGNSPGTLNVVGPVTFNAGSNFDVEIGATAADLLNATGAVVIAPGATVTATFFPGADGFVGDIVTGASVTGTFTPGSGTTLSYATPGAVSLTAASSSSMNGGMSAGASQGFTFLDTVLGEAQKSASLGKTLWGTALWSRSTRTAATTSSRGFDQHSNGGAVGGDVMSAGDFTLGLAAGYLDGDAVTSGGGSRTSITGYHAAAYSTYMMGGTYLTSAVTAAYQDQDAKRNVFSGGVLVGAQGSPEAWLGGVGLGIGHEFPLNNAFTITPRANLGYQHMARDGYTETGGGAGALALDAISTDTVRGRVGAELAFKVADKNAMWSVRPSINAALAKEWRAGDSTTTGTFRTTGAAFNNNLDSRDQTYLALGAGVDMTVGYGVTAFVNYDGGVGGDAERSGGWRLGARMEW